MWKFIKIGIIFFLLFLGASCTASKHVNNHMRECATELQLFEKIPTKQLQNIAQEMKSCIEGKLGFPENIFALWRPVRIDLDKH